MLEQLRDLLYPVDERDHRLTDKDGVEANEQSKGGKDLAPDGNGEYSNAGARTDRWFSYIEERVDENTERSRQNQMYLSRMDYRTVWIMRLLLGVLTALVVGLVGQFLGVPL